MSDDRVPLHGSSRPAWPGATAAGTLHTDDEIDVTVWLRPRKGGEVDAARAQALSALPPGERTYASRAELRAATGADPDDVARVSAYLGKHHVRIAAENWRSVVARGTISALASAFDAQLESCLDPRQRAFRHRSGTMHVPREIAERVRGVFGFAEWPHSHALEPQAPARASATPHPGLLARDVASHYAFPNADGSGQTIAILQFGGTFEPDDFAAAMRLNGVAPARVITKHVDRASAARSGETEFDIELALDTQIAGAIAPGATLAIYAAPHSERGFLDAARTVIFDDELRPAILSISYGWPERLWSAAALDIFDELFAAAALLGVSVFCSSGDSGADVFGDEPHVRSPASSRFVHGCGGTHAELSDGAIVNENAWSRTGGGFSTRTAPAWQHGIHERAAAPAGTIGRGVPDVSAQVLPGYRVVHRGAELPVGGTSAVAPLWAALTARLNQLLGTPIGFFAPLLYANAASDALFRPIERGTNGVYHAREGWNPCTGLGSPVGGAILAALAGTGR